MKRTLGFTVKDREKLAGKFDRNLRWLYSLFRRKEFPDRYLPSAADFDRRADIESARSSAFRKRLAASPGRPDLPVIPVSLSYMPIAKNIRQLATTRYHAVRMGRSVQIASGNEREEQDFREQGKGDWHPWLWGRIPRADAAGARSPADLWALYFEPAPPIPEKDGPLPGRTLARWKKRILDMGACCGESFRLNEAVRKHIDNWGRAIAFPEDRPVLGVHVRRGDAASADLSRSTRRSRSLEDYLEAADLLCERYGIDSLYLSTESQREIDRARELRPGLNILSLHHDRSVFPTIESDEPFIEEAALRNPEIVEPLVLSALADLWFLSRCRAFIGTFNSEFSMLGWLLCVGQNRRIVPYADLTTRRRQHSYQGKLDFWMDLPPSD